VIVGEGIGRATVNPFQEDGRVLISKVSSTGNLKENILESVNLIGGFSKIIEKGDEILLKPNYNSADASPASSDPEFVKTVIELLYENGASKIVLGESSMQLLTTRKVMQKTGTLAKAEEAGAELLFFDEGKYVKVNVGGKYLKGVSLPEAALNAKKLVYVCCMKTHFRARFSMSLKLTFGFVKRSERLAFHVRNLQEKIGDLNLVVHPNLIIMDGRKCFITGGPFHGDVRTPNAVMASGDRIANDVEGIKMIESFEGASLKDDPWKYPQIRHAIELGLGVKSEQEYRVISRQDSFFFLPKI
jgi:uncharacterized protein (DUF362 family)